MRDDYRRFVEAGGEVVMVSMAAPAQVAAFRRMLKLPFACYCDPGRFAYRTFGVPLGTIGQVAGVAIWGAGLRALWRGGLGIPRGDAYQLHGAFVVDPQSRLRYIHRPENSADYPDHDEMIATVRQAAADG